MSEIAVKYIIGEILLGDPDSLFSGRLNELLEDNDEREELITAYNLVRLAPESEPKQHFQQRTQSLAWLIDSLASIEVTLIPNGTLSDFIEKQNGPLETKPLFSPMDSTMSLILADLIIQEDDLSALRLITELCNLGLEKIDLDNALPEHIRNLSRLISYDVSDSISAFTQIKGLYKKINTPNFEARCNEFKEEIKKIKAQRSNAGGKKGANMREKFVPIMRDFKLANPSATNQDVRDFLKESYLDTPSQSWVDKQIRLNNL